MACSALICLPTNAQAQSVPVPTPDTLVSVCSGVSLPPSVVTGILDPVLTGIYGPIENRVNGLLTILDPLVLPLLPAPLSVNVNGLLTTAASGSNIGLNVLASDGTLVGPSDQCDASADSFTLDNPAGIAIGGNQITGLGDTGEQAVAGEIDSIAVGNRASTDATALGSIALGTDASVGAGAVGSIAIGDGANATAANSVALGAGSVADREDSVSVGAPGAERQITNVAAGTQATDAVNLGQLNAVAALIPDNAVEYDDGTQATVTLGGASGTLITNVQAGEVSATSTDAVNGAQLSAVQDQVDDLQTQVDGIEVQVDANTTAIANLQTSVGGNTTAITNLTTQVNTNTTDITNLTTQVAGNTTAITNLTTRVDNNETAITELSLAISNGAIGPVQYSNPATPTTPNGGTPTNDVTLVGAAPGPVGLHNVDDGLIAAGSTDAVNGGQIFDLFEALPDSIANAVTYDNDARTSVTLNAGGGAVTIRNVANGVAATDAVNVQQLAASSANAVSIANSYTDTQIALLGDQLEVLDDELRRSARDARAGTSAALAAAGMPQASEPGRSMLAGGVGMYRGKVGFALGGSMRASDGRSIYKLGVTYDSSRSVGANAGVGFEF